MKATILLTLVSALIFSLNALATPKVGERFPELTLEDQHGKTQSIDDTTKLVIMAFEMEASEPLGEFLQEQKEDFLSKHKARYVADISGMPSLISKFFAIPKMQDYNYSLMLNREDHFAEQYQKQEGKLSVYTLNNGVIKSIDFVDGAAAPSLFK